MTSLRRLALALMTRGKGRISETNWWTVAVELAVVVLGILIAFKLNEWDQGRQDRQEEAALLRHLVEETAADIAAIRSIRDEHRESAANYVLLASAVRDPVAAAQYRGLGEAGCNLLRLPAVRYHSPSGLEAGERAEIIRDAELRHLIRKTDAERSFNDRQLDYFRDSFNRYSEVIEPYMQWRLVSPGSATCSIDIAALANDREARSLLPKAGRDQLRFAEYRQRELGAAEEVAERAACLRARRCVG